jgi:hypothetical protein
MVRTLHCIPYDPFPLALMGLPSTLQDSVWRLQINEWRGGASPKRAVTASGRLLRVPATHWMTASFIFNLHIPKPECTPKASDVLLCTLENQGNRVFIAPPNGGADFQPKMWCTAATPSPAHKASKNRDAGECAQLRSVDRI